MRHRAQCPRGVKGRSAGRGGAQSEGGSVAAGLGQWGFGQIRSAVARSVSRSWIAGAQRAVSSGANQAISPISAAAVGAAPESPPVKQTRRTVVPGGRL